MWTVWGLSFNKLIIWPRNRIKTSRQAMTTQDKDQLVAELREDLATCNVLRSPWWDHWQSSQAMRGASEPRETRFTNTAKRTATWRDDALNTQVSCTGESQGCELFRRVARDIVKPSSPQRSAICIAAPAQEDRSRDNQKRWTAKQDH